MTDLMIIAIIFAAAGLGVHAIMKHLKGQGACCGGGGYKLRKKKLSNVLYKKTFFIDGMHCDHCKNRVEEIVNDIAGLAGSVDLKKGELTISYAEHVDDALIRAQIERVGYSVTRIEE